MRGPRSPWATGRPRRRRPSRSCSPGGGGTARGTMNSALRSLPDGRTELVTTASLELTGRVMQVGSRMIKGVSHQLFKQFVAKAKKQLESGEAAPTATPAASGAAPAGSPGARPAAQPVIASGESEAISIVSLLFKTLLAAIVNFFRRLFGKPATDK